MSVKTKNALLAARAVYASADEAFKTSTTAENKARLVGAKAAFQAAKVAHRKELGK